MILLVLLTVVAVGLLSLSAIAMRSSRSQVELLEARSNARLAMMLAIGEVQKSLGPDRSAAAPASMVLEDPSEPHCAGVWETWTWDPSTDEVPGPSEYTKEKAARFRGWLASDPQGSESRLDPGFPEDGPRDPVTLVGEGSARTMDGDEVPVEVRGGFVPLAGARGDAQGYAWAVLPEDFKAHTQPGRGDRSQTPEAEYARMFAPDEGGLAGLQWTGILGDDRPRRQRALTTSSLSLAGAEPLLARDAFHHLTPWSEGLLTDAADGGMRRDLTTEFESFDESPLRDQRLYQAPGTHAEPTWAALKDYYDLARSVKDDSGGGMSPVNIDPHLDSLKDYYSRRRYDPAAPLEQSVLMPVVARMDVVFSLVTHNVEDSHEQDYLARDAARKDPRYDHYMPWLVFEPIVTLWNPYNVPIRFSAPKLFIDKLPIGFRFFKQEHTWETNRWADLRKPTDTQDYWRPLHTHLAGGWNEERGEIIGNFFVQLHGGSPTSGGPESTVTLDPGEVRVLTSWVPPGSTWGEVKDRFMIERNQGVDTIVRAGDGIPYMGGWNRTGGFRFDHLAKQGGRRNPESLYDWENNYKGHLVVLRGPDRLLARVRIIDPEDPDDDASAENDRTRSFSMRLALMASDASRIDESDKVIQEIAVEAEDFFKLYKPGEPKIIEHEIVAQEAYQAPDDRGPGGKSSFAVFSVTAKSTRDLLHPTKGWLFGNPVTTGVTLLEEQAPYAAQPYELSFLEVFGQNSFPMVDVDVNTGTRGFFGPGKTSEFGLTAATMFTLPREPMISIGQFHGANPLATDELPRFNYPVGNSHAHPLIPPGKVSDGIAFDHSFAMNRALWDSYCFSTLSRDAEVGPDEFANGAVPLNPRLRFHAGAVSPEEALNRMTKGDPATRSKRVASHQMLRGPFNVNSTNVEAWRAVLSGLREQPVPTRNGGQRNPGAAACFPRFVTAISSADESLSIGGGAGTGGVEATRAERWVGLHQLDDGQIEVLAEKIVDQIKLRGREDRGPILTIGEFVNRRPGPESALHSLKGLLQTAIEEANKVTPICPLEDGDPIVDGDSVPNPSALEGNTAEGSPAALLQGDILQALGSFLTTHSDTLRIRAYGRAGSPNHPVEAWCEAIVQRYPEYLDPSDPPEAKPELGSVNHRFGRRFRIVSFRWLSRDEV